MKYIIATFVVLNTSFAFADSICSFSRTDSDEGTAFKVVNEKDKNSEEKLILESLDVDGIHFQLSREGEAIELLVQKNGEDVSSTRWGELEGLNLFHKIAIGTVDCYVPYEGEEEPAE